MYKTRFQIYMRTIGQLRPSRLFSVVFENGGVACKPIKSKYCQKITKSVIQ